jgi:hypothetical protein
MIRLLRRIFRGSLREAETIDPRKDAWARIGLLLGLLQHAEVVINANLTLVYTNDPFGEEQIGNLLDQLANLKEFERKRTLGQLYRALQERTQIGPDSDEFFTQFVEDRNRFIHRLFTEPGFNINNPEDISRIRDFIDPLAERAIQILVMFNGFLDMWAEKHGLSSANDDAIRPEPFRTAVQQFKDEYRRRASGITAQDDQTDG